MLAMFPEILFLAPLSALVLRVCLAAILGLTAWAHVSRPDLLPRMWALAEIVVAAALFVGAWTQPAALVAAAWLFTSLFIRDMRVFPKSTVILALVICASLVVTGPGAYAFDWPL